MRIATVPQVLNSIRYWPRAAFLLSALVLLQGVSVPGSLADDRNDHADQRDRRDDGDHDGHAQAQKTAIVSMPLSGTGVEAKVTFSKPSPVLTSNPANTAAKDATLTVSVTGTGPLKLTDSPGITKTSGALQSKFKIAGGTCSAGKEIAPGETCTIAIKYTPANKETSRAYVTLTGSGAREKQLHSESFESN
jgi:hypothetical protein